MMSNIVMARNYSCYNIQARFKPKWRSYKCHTQWIMFMHKNILLSAPMAQQVVPIASSPLNIHNSFLLAP